MTVSVFRLSVRPVESALSTFYHYVCTIVSAVDCSRSHSLIFGPLPSKCGSFTSPIIAWACTFSILFSGVPTSSQPRKRGPLLLYVLVFYMTKSQMVCNAASSTLGAAFGSKRQSFDVGTFFCGGVDTLAAGQTSSIPL